MFFRKLIIKQEFMFELAINVFFWCSSKTCMQNIKTLTSVKLQVTFRFAWPPAIRTAAAPRRPELMSPPTAMGTETPVRHRILS